MCAAIDRIELATDEELATYKKAQDINTDELTAAAEALARAQRDFVNSADPVKSFQQALGRRDWYDVRYVVRQVLMAAVGEVFCAAWFTAVRDVSLLNEESPASAGIADFSARVAKFAGKTEAPEDLARHLELAKIRNDVLQARINTLGAQVQKLTEQLTESKSSATVAEPSKFCWRRLFSWK